MKRSRKKTTTVAETAAYERGEQQQLQQQKKQRQTRFADFAFAKMIFSKHTPLALTVSYMARTATGSTAEMMLEKVKISTGARVMFMLYPVMLP